LWSFLSSFLGLKPLRTSSPKHKSSATDVAEGRKATWRVELLVVLETMGKRWSQIGINCSDFGSAFAEVLDASEIWKSSRSSIVFLLDIFLAALGCVASSSQLHHVQNA